MPYEVVPAVFNYSFKGIWGLERGIIDDITLHWTVLKATYQFNKNEFLRIYDYAVYDRPIFRLVPGPESHNLGTSYVTPSKSS